MGKYETQRKMYLDKAIELYATGMAVRKISRIISVPESTIRHWIINFASENIHSDAMKQNTSSQKKPESSQQTVKALEAEINRLKGQLTKAEIKVEAYNELINVAEGKFKIQIRKKAGAKQ